MNFPRLAAWLFLHLIVQVASRRDPDFIIGESNPAGAYLRRWYLTAWCGWFRDIAEDLRTFRQRAILAVTRRLFNLYLHQFLRDDDDRALHDHPSWGLSLILHNAYIEHTIEAGGIHRRQRFAAGALRFMPTSHAHRIELERDADGNPIPCWTLFLFGPTVREWGFHCPERGWVPWQQFTAAGAPGEVGPGCSP